MYKITSFDIDPDDNADGEFLIRIRLESNDEPPREKWITLRYPSREEATKQFLVFADALGNPLS